VSNASILRPSAPESLAQPEERIAHEAEEASLSLDRHFSPEATAEIIQEVDPTLQFSKRQIETLTWQLNNALHDYQRRKEDHAEPTSRQLQKDIKALQRGLQNLKLALPATKSWSLRNYLIKLGETYAAKRGGHPNLEPHTLSGVIPEWDWMEVTTVDHYRSDERLKQIVEQLIEGVTELLDWMHHTPPEMKRNTNWLYRIPHWLDDDPTAMEGKREPRVDSHREGPKVWLIGWMLPQIYSLTFHRSYGVSRMESESVTRYGPGVRFVLAALQRAGIDVSPETVIKYRDRARKAKKSKKVRVNKKPLDT
jgi:hypothetical protein